MALNRRQAGLLVEVATSSAVARSATSDVVLPPNICAARAMAFDRLTGRAGVEDMLDALFGAILPRQVMFHVKHRAFDSLR